MNIRIYILNLKRSKHRKDFMERQLSPLNIPYTFVDAVDGKSMNVSDFPDYNAYFRIKKYGRNLKNTEIATSISHLKALKMAQQDMYTYGNDWAVILEDDITILPCFVSALHALNTYQSHIHCVRLYERIKNISTHTDCIQQNPDFSLSRITYKNWGGALGYAVQKHAIDSYINHNAPILHKADKMLFGIPYKSIKVYQQRPRSVCITDTITSDIGYDGTHQYVGIRNMFTRIYRPWVERCQRYVYIVKHWKEYIR